MELLSELIKSILLSIKIMLTNKYFIIILLLAILIKIFYPKYRGFMGEFWVKVELSKLNKKEYTVLNNIMISTNNMTHQIDHIVLSKYGIFVIEMKNYYGLIKGEEKDDRWIQYLGRRKYYFKNPINQNYGHIKSLEEILNIDNKKLIGIICFSNQSKLKVKAKEAVVYLDNLVSLIKNFKIKLIEDKELEEYKKIILDNNIEDIKLRKDHVKNIKNKINDDNEKVKQMICPKCGGKLVLRNSKYGTFIGCENYPKCKFMKN